MLGLFSLKGAGKSQSDTGEARDFEQPATSFAEEPGVQPRLAAQHVASQGALDMPGAHQPVWAWRGRPGSKCPPVRNGRDGDDPRHQINGQCTCCTGPKVRLSPARRHSDVGFS